MPDFSWLLMLLIASHVRHYPLPAAAKITVGSSKNIAREEHKTGDPWSGDCSSYRLSKAEVRQQFATYHELTGPEIHDHYDIYDCEIDGTVTLNDKTFQWQSNEGNTLATTYPDGTWKTLGGKPSGDYANF